MTKTQDRIPNATLILSVGPSTLWRESDGRFVALNSAGHSDALLVIPSLKSVLYDRPEAFSALFRSKVWQYIFQKKAEVL